MIYQRERYVDDGNCESFPIPLIFAPNLDHLCNLIADHLLQISLHLQLLKTIDMRNWIVGLSDIGSKFRSII